MIISSLIWRAKVTMLNHIYPSHYRPADRAASTSSYVILQLTLCWSKSSDLASNVVEMNSLISTFDNFKLKKQLKTKTSSSHRFLFLLMEVEVKHNQNFINAVAILHIPNLIIHCIFSRSYQLTVTRVHINMTNLDTSMLVRIKLRWWEDVKFNHADYFSITQILLAALWRKLFFAFQTGSTIVV